LRPPEARERGVAAGRRALERDGIRLEELRARGRDRLLARDLEHGVVDVAGVDLRRLARDELGPVAGAAGDLEHRAPAQDLGHAVAQPFQLVLALRLVVDLLVDGGAFRVVLLELR
jgi:hypothetical protein